MRALSLSLSRFFPFPAADSANGIIPGGSDSFIFREKFALRSRISQHRQSPFPRPRDNGDYVSPSRERKK